MSKHGLNSFQQSQVQFLKLALQRNIGYKFSHKISQINKFIQISSNKCTMFARVPAGWNHWILR